MSGENLWWRGRNSSGSTREGGDREQKELMSSGSRGIPGVCKAITGKKGVETVMTELDKLKELMIFSADEFRDEEVGMAETTSFCHSAKKTSSQVLSVSERSPATAGSAYSILDEIKA